MKCTAWWCVLALSTAACGDKAEGAKREGEVAASAAIGVPECDRYMELAKACMSKASDAYKVTLQQSIDSNRELWTKASAAGGPARDSLTSTCKASVFALEQNPACK